MNCCIPNSLTSEAMKRCLVIAIAINQGYDKDFTGGALYFNSFENPNDWQYADEFTLLDVKGTDFYK